MRIDKLNQIVAIVGTLIALGIWPSSYWKSGRASIITALWLAMAASTAVRSMVSLDEWWEARLSDEVKGDER